VIGLFNLTTEELIKLTLKSSNKSGNMERSIVSLLSHYVVI